VDSWSVPSHLFLISGWSAKCSNYNDPMSCVSDPRYGPNDVKGQPGGPRPYAWTDITYLLSNAGISWGYYVGDQTCLVASCANDPKPEGSTTPGWDPLLGFTDIKEQPQSGDIQFQSDFDAAVAAGTLPQVSWVIPGGSYSEHPGHGSLHPGYEHVTNVLNEIGANTDLWNSTAIFLSWDDWGGFYDHEQPIKVDRNGYGIRTPGLMISPYAKTAFVDHQTLSFDAYLKFIEDRFLGGQRLDPANDGRPDSRPTVREDVKRLGDAFNEFDFSQAPRPWVPLPN
jgi:phospholipase C